jgi:coenzyme F420-dependent glucose-6-phosphate dehydrogenase
MKGIFYFCGHEQFQPEILVQHAMLAEKAGFNGIMTSEHFHPWVADESAAGFALSTLGAMAVRTSHIQLLTGVITPLFRFHPAVVAQAAATIDRLSDGRFMLGLGTGEAINEASVGQTFPPYKERARRIEEAITIITKLLHGEKLTYNGTYYSTKDAKLYSPPVHNIPIFMAAAGSQSAKLAAKITDGVITSVKNVENTIKEVKDPALQENPNAQLIASRWVVYAQNDDEAYQALRPWRGLRVPSRETATDPMVLQEEADQMNPSDIVSHYTLASDPESYIQAYLPLIEELHADIVVIQTTSAGKQEDLIQMLGKEVVPTLKKAFR